MQEHINDPYVQRAQREGYRSRAAYKLLEIDARDHLLKPGMVVIDLGATPGGWSQVAAAKVGATQIGAARAGATGKVIALDILPLAPIPGVDFIQGDFREASVLIKLQEQLQGKQVRLVISDMAPNITGIAITDQASVMYLAELALDLAQQQLQPGGAFLVKVFQGVGFEDYLKLMRQHFSRVVTRKPDASRDRSSELYLLGLEKR